MAYDSFIGLNARYVEIAVVLSLMAGCSPSLFTSIDECRAQSQANSPFPLNEFQKKELQDRQDGQFYSCMKRKGYKENEAYAKELWHLAFESPVATGTNEEKLATLNRMRFAEMYRADRSFWTRQ